MRLDRGLFESRLRDVRRLRRLSQRRGADQRTGRASADYLPAITFTTAPASGVAITADFGVLWLCRFADDVQDFEEFMSMLFEFRTLRLMTVRP